MKVNPSVKPICDHCRVIRRNGNVMVICKSNPRHKALDMGNRRFGQDAMAEIEDMRATFGRFENEVDG